MWAAILGAVGFASTSVSELPEDSGSMPGIEAQTALNLLRERFPGNNETATTRVVFVAAEEAKVVDAANHAIIVPLVEEVSRGGQVAGTVSPFQAQAVSEDGSTAYATVTRPRPLYFKLANRKAARQVSEHTTVGA